MKINFCGRNDLEDLVFNHPGEFLARIHAPEIFVARQFYDPTEILRLRRRVFDQGLATAPSWHPLLEGCPDYHRLHDNYPKAHVKSQMHAFYFHGWYEHNRSLFNYFHDIFKLKCALGKRDIQTMHHTPSQGFVARVNFQNYPRGGGHICEHIDPHSPFALIQTLVQGSQPRTDLSSGGLFARAADGAEKVYLDYHTQPGDLMVLSPAIPHGVDPVDPQEPYDWRVNSGKWTILPLFVASDDPGVRAEKPRELHSDQG